MIISVEHHLSHNFAPQSILGAWLVRVLRLHADDREGQTVQMKPRDPLRLLGFVDQFFIIAGAIGAYGFCYGHYALPWTTCLAMVAGAIMFALTAYARKLYTYERMESFIRQLMPFAFTYFQFMVAVMATLFLLPGVEEHSKTWLMLWMVTTMAGMMVMRSTFWLVLSRNLRNMIYARKVILVGASEKAEMMIRHFAEHRGLYNIVGLFVTDDDSRSVMASHRISGAFQRIPLMASFEQLDACCRTMEVDDIIITPGLEQSAGAEGILKALENLPCSIKYCIPGNFFSRPLADVELISHIPVVTIFHTPLRGTSLVIKRLEDVLLASLAILITSPIMLAAALLIALDGQGNIIFRQKRHGFGGREFEILKFRSMRVLTEAEQQDVQQATRNDMRVTPIGRILRRFSLDELPQLFNVLWGDMSMVGPRPHAIKHNFHYQELINGYVARQRIKPGITGWAQINGWRGETDTLEKMRKRVEHDLYYVENWSLWFDLKIIILTAFTFMLHKNAY